MTVISWTRSNRHNEADAKAVREAAFAFESATLVFAAESERGVREKVLYRDSYAKVQAPQPDRSGRGNRCGNEP